MTEPARGPTTDEAEVDEIVGPYRLRFEIAAGGMAKVFLAVKDGPSGFSKIVAVKRIHDHLAREREFIEMFLDEARICSQINHPNVCAIVDFGESNGAQFLAMEYLLGESLRAVHKAMGRTAGPRNAVLAARIVAEVCEGLHAAHELRNAAGEPLQVVHRDVSPQNVFVTYDGAVKVMDFGIATARDRVHQTDTGLVKGKFAYMSPEQVRGEAVDRRADVWALGVLIWELVAQRRLFGRRNDAETIQALLNEGVPPLVATPGDDLSGLDRIIARALDRNLATRYATARDLGRDLNRWIASRGEAIGTVDLADWMNQIFPGGYARKQQIVRLAQTDRATIPKVYSDSGTTGSGLASQVRERAESSTLSRRSPLRTRQLIAGASVLAVAVLTGSIGGYWLFGPEDPGLVAPTASPVAVAPVAVAPIVPATAVAPAAAPIAVPVAAAAEPATVPAAPAVPLAPTDSAPDTEPAVHEVATHEVAEREAEAPVGRRVGTKAARPAGAGFVDIATPGGWAAVYDGRRRLGTTPGRFSLPAGHHVLRVNPFDHDTGTRNVPVDVVAGESVRLRIDLRH